MDTIIQREIGLFFDEPKVYHAPPRQYSVLYLLRRDIDTALGYSRQRAEQFGVDGIYDPNQPFFDIKSLFLAVSGILTGVDLIAKFYAGRYDTSGTGERFKAFFKEYFPQDIVDAPNIMWQFRNAIVHSYGLFGIDNKGNEYGFGLTHNKGKLLQMNSDGVYIICGTTLFLAFEAALGAYFQQLNTDTELQNKFHIVFAKCGTTGMDIVPRAEA